jgi:hypothetical protein
VSDRLRPDALVTGAEPAYALQRSGVGEAGAVVADLGKDTGPGEVVQPGEAGDLVVGVLGERHRDSLAELLDAVTLDVEGGQQPRSLGAHRLLDQRVLAQLRATQLLVQPGRQLVDSAFAPTIAQRGGDAGFGQLGRGRRVGAVASTARASGLARLVALPPAKAAKNPGWYSRSTERSSLPALLRRHVASW